jgi:hypothetical protein
LISDKEKTLERFVRNPKEFWIGLIYIFIGSAALFLGRDLEMGTAGEMGPAYSHSAIN